MSLFLEGGEWIDAIFQGAFEFNVCSSTGPELNISLGEIPVCSSSQFDLKSGGSRLII